MEFLLVDLSVLGAVALLIRFGGLESLGVLGYGGILYGLWFFGLWRGVAVWLALLGVCVAIDVVAWIRRRRKRAAISAHLVEPVEPVEPVRLVEPLSEEPPSLAVAVFEPAVAVFEIEESAA